MGTYTVPYLFSSDLPQNLAFKSSIFLLDTRLGDTGRNIKWLLTRPENHFKSNQICFYFNLGKVFQSPEFQAKLFLSEFEWVDLRAS